MRRLIWIQNGLLAKNLMARLLAVVVLTLWTLPPALAQVDPYAAQRAEFYTMTTRERAALENIYAKSFARRMKESFEAGAPIREETLTQQQMAQYDPEGAEVMRQRGHDMEWRTDWIWRLINSQPSPYDPVLLDSDNSPPVAVELRQVWASERADPNHGASVSRQDALKLIARINQILNCPD